MAINSINELFWKVFQVSSSGSDDPDLTKMLNAIVKSDKSKLDQYFTNAIDQIAFDTQDWKRLRELLIDLFNSHRSLITNSAGISDPHLLSNDDLDELFRSFGFTESVPLKDYDNNPLENKVQLFLDLVNLYKIKGTPRSILEVLQYYGIPELDIFEFWLQKIDPDNLIFKGDVIVGTSLNPSSVNLPYDLLTQGDPHWMMSENQILKLDALNKINLPSKSPYFAVQPVVEVGIENSILVRLVQDQYAGWDSTGDLPPQDAEISILGVNASLLELYLLTLYSFQKDYDVGSDIGEFACYDGTNTSAVDIIAEYESIIAPPVTRDNKDAKWQAYLDLFTRERERHFLYGKGDNAATTVLNLINPALITDIEALTSNNTAVLQSLLKDLALWVRNNIGFGFVNLGYIFFGLNQLFEDLKPVINFFKPYRARLIVLELLQFKNLLTESIPLDDEFGYDIDSEFFDYMTGNSASCCSEDGTSVTCMDTTTGTTYSRDTYDCGSYHDIGAVTDIAREVEIEVEQYLCDSFRCPPGCPSTDSTSTVATTYGDVCDRLNGLPPANLDGTMALIVSPDSTDCSQMIPLTCTTVPYVFSETLIDTFEKIENLETGSSEITVIFDSPRPDTNYLLNVNLFNISSETNKSMYGIVVSDKTTLGFTVTFSSPIDSSNYRLSWSINQTTTNSGINNFNIGDDTLRVDFDSTSSITNYAIGTCISNTVDANPSIYNFTVSNQDSLGFDIQLSGAIDSANYNLEWSAYDSTSFIPSGLTQIPIFSSSDQALDVDFPAQSIQDNDKYSLAISIINTVDPNPSIYSYIVTRKNNTDFKVRFSDVMDSTNYYLSWAITDSAEEEYTYRQESGFRLFDTMGRFDCTHGFDMVEITMTTETQLGVIIQEDSDGNGWILQEEAVDTLQDNYGILWE